MWLHNLVFFSFQFYGTQHLSNDVTVAPINNFKLNFLFYSIKVAHLLRWNINYIESHMMEQNHIIGHTEHTTHLLVLELKLINDLIICRAYVHRTDVMSSS